MAKLSRIDRELRKYEQLIIAAEREQLAALELVCDIETMLSPHPTDKLTSYFSTFTRFTQQVVADLLPALSVLSAHTALSRPTHASSIGQLIVEIPITGGHTQVTVSLAPASPCSHLSTANSNIVPLDAWHLAATFSSVHIIDGECWDGLDAADEDATVNVSMLLDPNQYAALLLGCLPAAYCGPALEHQLTNMSGVESVELEV